MNDIKPEQLCLIINCAYPELEYSVFQLRNSDTDCSVLFAKRKIVINCCLLWNNEEKS
jgi:hypothetical protein